MSAWVWVFSVGAAVSAVLIRGWRRARKLRRRQPRSAVGELPHPGPAGPQRVAVVLNPSKAQAQKARQLVLEAVRRAGWREPLFLETTVDDPGTGQAREALDWKADVVLACGGDGTVRAVAEVLKHRGVAMGLLPLGTGNLLARNLGLDVTDLAGCVRFALFGKQRFIDTGTLRITDDTALAESDNGSERTFLVIAGIGLDAEMVSDTHDVLKRLLGWLAYSEAGVRHLPGSRQKVRFSLDGGPLIEQRVRSVLFCNCGLLPGGIDFVPGALIDDGLLDVVVMSPRSALGWIAMTIKVLFRHRRKLPVIDFYRTRSIVVRSAKPQQAQIDGDPVGQATEIRATVQPRSLLVRVA